jgi:hypothetical protein
MDGSGGLNDDLVVHLPGPKSLCDGVNSVLGIAAEGERSRRANRPKSSP